MIRPLWWVMAAALILVRGWILFLFVSHSSWSSLGLVAIEGASLVFGVQNLVVAKMRDYSWRGLWVAAAYLIGVGVLPHVHSQSPGGAILILSAIAVEAWALWHLRDKFSLAGTCWVSLVETGPYRMIRHPQGLARIALCVGYALCVERGSVDAWRCWLAIGIAVSIVVAEEATLRREADYRGYAQRVRWRFIPGLI